MSYTLYYTEGKRTEVIAAGEYDECVTAQAEVRAEATDMIDGIDYLTYILPDEDSALPDDDDFIRTPALARVR